MTTRTLTSTLAPALPRAGTPRPSLLVRLKYLAALARSRRALARLDAHLLADIGLTEAEAGREAARPRWDAPDAWLR